MFADFKELTKNLHAKLESYQFRMDRLPGTESFANLVSKTLYGKRFFPYYTFNIVAGLNKNGKGVVYGYDAIGSYGEKRVTAAGSGAHMINPYLDSEVEGYNNPNHHKKGPLTPEKGVEIMVKAFQAASERDIYTGDTLEIVVISGKGVEKIQKQLRID